MKPLLARATVVDCTILYVSDGDSFHASINGTDVACRLYGADAPETGQPYGRAARKALAELIEGKTLHASIANTDCYHRTVLDLWAFTGIRVAALMIREGFAWATTRWSPQPLWFLTLQADARTHGRGLWADPHPTPPWTWRRMQGHDFIHARSTRRLRIRRP